jgi:uracil-DNA glycosylase family 4
MDEAKRLRGKGLPPPLRQKHAGDRGPASTEPPQECRERASAEPSHECPKCPRLVAFRQESRTAHEDWFNAPVPTFFGPEPRLLIVGLAPGLRGANRTGRPFTGDFAGDLLYETLLACGLAAGIYAQRADDGLRLEACAITNAVRCVPPQNKPLPAEIANCRPYLAATIASLPKLEVILALGRIAHESVLRAFGHRLAEFPFAHGAQHSLVMSEGRALVLYDSYHCSRYNTNTGVLTVSMFRQVFDKICAQIEIQATG